MARSRNKHTRRNKPKRRFYKRKGLWIFLLICVLAGLAGLKYADQRLEPYRQRAEISVTGETVGGTAFEGSDEIDLFLSGKKLRDLLDELFGA